MLNIITLWPLVLYETDPSCCHWGWSQVERGFRWFLAVSVSVHQLGRVLFKGGQLRDNCCGRYGCAHVKGIIRHFLLPFWTIFDFIITTMFRQSLQHSSFIVAISMFIRQKISLSCSNNTGFVRKCLLSKTILLFETTSKLIYLLDAL